MKKRYLYLIIGLMVNLFAKSAINQEKICRDFLNLDTRKEMIVSIKKNKSVSIDINNDGKEEDVTIKRDVAHETGAWYDDLVYPNQHKIDTNLELRWFKGKQILFVNNHYYIAYYKTVKKSKAAYITSIDINIEHAVCKFRYKNLK